MGLCLFIFLTRFIQILSEPSHFSFYGLVTLKKVYYGIQFNKDREKAASATSHRAHKA